MADFHTKFATLKEYNIIPQDQDETALSPSMRNAIENLGDDEINALRKLADETNSHISLHQKGSGIVVAGL